MINWNSKPLPTRFFFKCFRTGKVCLHILPTLKTESELHIAFYEKKKMNTSDFKDWKGTKERIFCLHDQKYYIEIQKKIY